MKLTALTTIVTLAAGGAAAEAHTAAMTAQVTGPD
jgi:hypothetical protein